MKLIEYIEKYYNGSQSAFGRQQGVQKQQVYQWVSKGYVVINHVLYSPRRELKRLHTESFHQSQS